MSSGSAGTLTLTAAEPGVYRFECDADRGWFDVEVGTQPFALTGLDESIHLIHPVSLGDWNFFVPAGVAEFYVQVAGSGGERVKCGLYNARNERVAEQDEISVGHKFFAKRKSTAGDEIWRLKVERSADHPMEDFSIQLYGIPSIIAVDPAALLKPL